MENWQGRYCLCLSEATVRRLWECMSWWHKLVEKFKVQWYGAAGIDTALQFEWKRFYRVSPDTGSTVWGICGLRYSVAIWVKALLSCKTQRWDFGICVCRGRHTGTWGLLTQGRYKQGKLFPWHVTAHRACLGLLYTRQRHSVHSMVGYWVPWASTQMS